MNRKISLLLVEVIFSLLFFSFSTMAKEFCPHFICPPLSAGVNNLTIHAEPSTSGTAVIKCLTTCQCPLGYGVSKVVSSGSLSLGDVIAGPDYFEVCGKKHTGSWLFYEDYCNNTNPITLQIYGGNYGFTSYFTNGNFVNVTQIVCSPLLLSCPPCPQPSEWSDCVNNIQTRTNYKCDASTNYQCLPYIETRNCTIIIPSCPPCPSDTDWTVCVNNEQSRIRYVCGDETGYVCLPIVEKRNCEVANQTYDPCLYADFQIYSCSYTNSTPTKGNITLILKNVMNVELRNLTATVFYPTGTIKNYNLKPDNVLPKNIYKGFTIEDVDVPYSKILITTHCPYVEEESPCDGVPFLECATGYTENYRCFGNWLQKEYRELNCSLSWRNYQYCEYGCENNRCKNLETFQCIYKIYLTPNFDYQNDTKYTWIILANDYSSGNCPSQINYTIWEHHAGNCGDVIIPSYLLIDWNTSKTFNISVNLGGQEGACEITLRIISPMNNTVETGKYILNEKVRGKGILESIFEFFVNIFSFLRRSTSSRFLLFPLLRK